MSSAPLYFLVLQGFVFLIWAIVAFQWLFALRAHAVAESGSAWPGMTSQLRALRAGFVDARYRSHRRLLLPLTVALLVLAGLSTQIFQ